MVTLSSYLLVGLMRYVVRAGGEASLREVLGDSDCCPSWHLLAQDEAGK
jgi:hypothetical protein